MSDERKGSGAIGFTVVILVVLLLAGVVGVGVFLKHRARRIEAAEAMDRIEWALERRRDGVGLPTAEHLRALASQDLASSGPPTGSSGKNLGYQFRTELVTRQPDGSLKILISGSFLEPTQVGELQFGPVSIPNVGDCRVVPPAEPYRETIDFAIHTPRVPKEMQKLSFNLSYRMTGVRGPFGFEGPFMETLEVDLGPTAAKAE